MLKTTVCIFMNRISYETIFVTAPQQLLMSDIISVNRQGRVL